MKKQTQLNPWGLRKFTSCGATKPVNTAIEAPPYRPLLTQQEEAVHHNKYRPALSKEDLRQPSKKKLKKKTSRKYRPIF